MKATPPSPAEAPWLTFCLVALIFAAAVVPLELVIYDRDNAGEWWRFATSWLKHYDLAHLASNAAAFAVLGAFVERALSPQFMLWLIAAVLLLCTVLLHLALPHYVLYAGISPISYALLGSTMVLVWQRRPAMGLWLLMAATAAQFQSWAGEGLVGTTAARPAWELHGLAFLAGTLATICWRISHGHAGAKGESFAVRASAIGDEDLVPERGIEPRTY